eukprot:m51a1_g11800 hypothetical protein (662) ;mRNA; f:328121-331603
MAREAAEAFLEQRALAREQERVLESRRRDAEQSRYSCAAALERRRRHEAGESARQAETRRRAALDVMALESSRAQQRSAAPGQQPQWCPQVAPGGAWLKPSQAAPRPRRDYSATRHHTGGEDSGRWLHLRGTATAEPPSGRTEPQANSTVGSGIAQEPRRAGGPGRPRTLADIERSLERTYGEAASPRWLPPEPEGPASAHVLLRESSVAECARGGDDDRAMPPSVGPMPSNVRWRMPVVIRFDSQGEGASVDADVELSRQLSALAWGPDGNAEASVDTDPHETLAESAAAGDLPPSVSQNLIAEQPVIVSEPSAVLPIVSVPTRVLHARLPPSRCTTPSDFCPGAGAPFPRAGSRLSVVLPKHQSLYGVLDSVKSEAVSLPPMEVTCVSRGLPPRKKIIFVGDSTVGKTCTIKRFCEGVFDASHNPTSGVEYSTKTTEAEVGCAVRMQLWDSSGLECFRDLIPHYIEDSNYHFVVIMYDITNRSTFESVDWWAKQFADSEPQESIQSPAAVRPPVNTASAVELHLGLIKERHTYATPLAAPAGTALLSMAHAEATGCVQLAFSTTPPCGALAELAGQWAYATVHAEREGEIREVFVEEEAEAAARGRQPVVVVVTGRVMGSRRGTPMLKPDVHCIGVDPVPDSEVDSCAEDARSARQHHF